MRQVKRQPTTTTTTTTNAHRETDKPSGSGRPTERERVPLPVRVRVRVSGGKEREESAAATAATSSSATWVARGRLCSKATCKMLQISVTRFATQAATERLRLRQKMRVCDSPFRFVISLMTKMDREAATAAVASFAMGQASNWDICEPMQVRFTNGLPCGNYPAKEYLYMYIWDILCFSL